MSSVPAYALRFVQYLDLMLLFGLPLFSWYGLRRSAQAIPREQRKAEQQHEVQVLDEPQGIGGHARQVGGASADGKAEVPRHRVIIRPDGAVLYAISTGFQRMMQLGAQRLADDLDLQMLDRHGRVAVDHCQLQA